MEAKAEGKVGSGQQAVGSQFEFQNLQAEILTPPSDRGLRGERTANLTFSATEEAPTTSLAPCPSSRKSEIRNPKSEISTPQSPIPNPLFAVRTPTAVVIDLGTEFGVEVEASGLSRATVFLGKIEMRLIDGGNVLRRTLQLTANQSAEVRNGLDHVAMIVREPSRPNAFVRQIPTGATRIGGQDARQSRSRPAYRLTDLGTLGGPESQAIGINAAGMVVGCATTADGYPHAFLYVDGVMTDLNLFRGPISLACAINNRGQIVGDFVGDVNDACHAFLYSAGKAIDLGDPTR